MSLTKEQNRAVEDFIASVERNSEKYNVLQLRLMLDSIPENVDWTWEAVLSIVERFLFDDFLESKPMFVTYNNGFRIKTYGENALAYSINSSLEREDYDTIYDLLHPLNEDYVSKHGDYIHIGTKYEGGKNLRTKTLGKGIKGLYDIKSKKFAVLLFSKEDWTKSTATKWAEEHEFK